jgi:hypothetical protein
MKTKSYLKLNSYSSAALINYFKPTPEVVLETGAGRLRLSTLPWSDLKHRRSQRSEHAL